MSSTISSTQIQSELNTEPKPLDASYGKLMMWFFIVSDALTFTGFLISYGFSRFKNIDSWPIADEVFTHFPGLHGVDAPMYYVALMTFILIFSSKSVLTKIIPESDGAGLRIISVSTPVCKPRPLKTTSFLIVFWLSFPI